MSVQISKIRFKMFQCMLCVFLMAALLLIFGAGCEKAPEKGWLTYRNDIARSGAADESLSAPLSLSWVFKPRHNPKPAWYEPAEELPRSHFDNAHYVTASGGMVYFGSTVDNKVYALNAKTGKIKWTFYTAGPVRCVPAIRNKRIYFGSDDGYVYCLHAVSGKLVWKYRAGPDDEKILGNGTMISFWPVRTNVLVDDGVAYFCAGVFPHEGIYICALDADNGSVVWKNDTMGDRAHELTFNGISPQGYLIASETTLYVPSGRAVPAAFDRRNGKFLFYMDPGSKFGGTWALLDRNELITGVDRSGTPAKGAYDTKTGERKGDAFAWYPGIDMVVDPEVSYIATDDGIVAINRAEYAEAEKSVREKQKQQKELGDTQKELQEKLEGASASAGAELNSQIVEIKETVSRLTEEIGTLKKAGKKWMYPRTNLHSLIRAGHVFTGGEGFVAAVDAGTGKELWSETVDGTAFGLAASDGRLYVSTDTGAIYCFREGDGKKGKEVVPSRNPEPYPFDRIAGDYESAVDEILKETGINKGWCLVLDSGSGRLAYELASRTDLNIIGIEHDNSKLRKARKRLDEAGLLGPRIRIENWNLASLPDYFANLIVSDGIITSDKMDYPPDEVYRVLRPCGGMVYFKHPSGGKVFKKGKSAAWVQKAGLFDIEATGDDTWFKATRGKLEGAGAWTHVFSDPQNTSCSRDNLVKGSLGVLWYGEPGPKGMVDRHAEATSPVSMNGRLFVQGEELIMAYDAYNGAFLWEREIPGAVRVKAKVDGGNLALTEEGLYVAAHDRCFLLDPSTGETVREYTLPSSADGGRRRWGYIAREGNILYGSAAMPLNEEYNELWDMFSENGRWKDTEDIPQRHKSTFERYSSRYPEPNERAMLDFQRSATRWRTMARFANGGEFYIKGAKTGNTMVSDMIFAMDAETGKLLWKHQGKGIAHITIALGDGKVYFAEAAITGAQKQRAVANRKKLASAGIYREGKDWDDHYQGRMGYTVGYEDIDARLVVALDAVSGEKRWEKLVDLTGCAGDAMGAAYHKNMLFFFGNYGNHDAWRHSGDQLKFRRITALSTDNGDVVWSRPLNYRTRPLIVGDNIILEPRACDYRTGEIVTRTHPITGKEVPWEFLRPGHTCAVTSASSSMLFTRSWTTLMYDIEGDRGVTLFGGIRPGCFINMIPANGLLLMPEASSGCTCSFPLRCSVVFKPHNKTPEEWSLFVTPGDMTPARHFAINLGAPADMRDGEGTLWFGYPNPRTVYGGNHYPNYGVKFDLKDNVMDNMGYFAGDFRGKQFEGTDKPWLFTSGCLGLTRCEIPLIDSGKDGPGMYTVRLGFLPREGDRAGSRMFDIMLQGVPVRENFDIMGAGGTPEKPVIVEFSGINVDGVLTIELTPKTENPLPEQAPVINFIEVDREDVGKITINE